VTTDLSCVGTRPSKPNCISTVRNIQRGVDPLPSDTTQESSEDSSEEEPELRRGERDLDAHFHCQDRVSRTLTAPLPTSLSGMVRNSTEPHQRLSEMAVSQSTWI